MVKVWNGATNAGCKRKRPDVDRCEECGRFVAQDRAASGATMCVGCEKARV